LIYRNVGLRFDGTVAFLRTNEAAISNGEECAMTNAGQAFLMTAGLFGLSFFAIFAFWLAEKLRVGSSRKIPR
jgi:hypothetical protein